MYTISAGWRIRNQSALQHTLLPLSFQRTALYSTPADSSVPQRHHKIVHLLTIHLFISNRAGMRAGTEFTGISMHAECLHAYSMIVTLSHTGSEVQSQPHAGRSFLRSQL
jgi:hypothetical protein